MRTIKFRAWHRFNKIMFKHVCKLGFSNWNGEEHHLVSVFARNHDEQACLDEAKNWEIMQFTGLTDKNGVEIFEGDIVLCDGNKNSLVVRYDDFGVPCLVNDKFMKSWDFSMLGAEGVFKQCDVIGNIYENPELLKREGND